MLQAHKPVDRADEAAHLGRSVDLTVRLLVNWIFWSHYVLAPSRMHFWNLTSGSGEFFQLRMATVDDALILVA